MSEENEAKQSPPPPASTELAASATPHPKWSARLLSAMCPGLGQITSGRLASGLLQLGVFLAALMTACILLIGQLVVAYRAAFSMDTNPQAELPDLTGAHFTVPFCLSLGVALLAVVWSIWDAGKEPGSDRRT